jgi:hypothetical protein
MKRTIGTQKTVIGIFCALVVAHRCSFLCSHFRNGIFFDLFMLYSSIVMSGTIVIGFLTCVYPYVIFDFESFSRVRLLKKFCYFRDI